MKFDKLYSLLQDEPVEEGLKDLGAAAAIGLAALSPNIQAKEPAPKPKIDRLEMAKHTDAFSEEITDEKLKKLAFEMLKVDEGVVLHLYDDAKGAKHKWKPGDPKVGNITIGIGHLVKPEEIKKFAKGIDEKIAFEIFDGDFKRELTKARDLFTRFDTYPTYLKLRLLNGTFRGEFKKGHDTVDLLNKGQPIKAAKAYLEGSGDKYRKDFQASLDSNEAGKPHGVKSRMLETRSAIIRYGIALRKWHEFLQSRKAK
jgi:hypothetical protein